MDDEQEPKGQPEGHPAWKEILDELPESLHPIVKPVLEKWDKGVNDRFAKIHEQYDPYKPFIEASVDADDLNRAYMLLNEIQNNPEEVVKQAIEAFELDYVSKADIPQQQQQTSEDYSYGFNSDEDDDEMTDITKHPAFLEMTKTLEKLQGTIDEQTEAQQEEVAQKEHEKYLSKLKEDHGEFNPMFVTALMSQGMDGVEAVKQYQGIVNQAAVSHVEGQNTKEESNPPVVMGADGTTGSGIPEVNVDLGAMARNDVNDLVVQMIKASSNNT